VLRGRAVQFLVDPEAPFRGAVAVDEESGAEVLGRTVDHADQSHRLVPLRGIQGGLRQCLRGQRCDHHVEDATAGQAHGEGVLVAVAETLHDSPAALQHLSAQLVDRALHAAAGHRSDDGARAVDGEGGAGAAWGAAGDGHDGGDGDVTAVVEPVPQFRKEVKHRRLPR